MVCVREITRAGATRLGKPKFGHRSTHRGRERRSLQNVSAFDPPADLAITCPRCQATATERFYGPCAECRTELRANLGGAQSERRASEYEPKMNVTPNAVALKDD